MHIKYLRTIEEGSLPLLNLRSFVVKKALYMRLHLHTLLNIMGLLKGGIGPYLT